MAKATFKKIISIPLTQIDFGERGRQDYGDIEDLAANIKLIGQLQPITISPTDDDDTHLLITGGRRYRAHEHLELTHIDCIVREVDNITVAELELIENIYRKDLTWQERCTMEYNLMLMKGLSLREMAEEIDSTKSQVGRHVAMGEALAQIPDLAKCKSLDDARKSMNKMRESIMAEVLTQKAEKEVHEKVEGEGAALGKIAQATQKEKPDVLEEVLIESKAVTSKDELITLRLKLAAGCYQVGDCIESMAQYGEPQSFHFAEIDPPYGIDLKKAKKQEGSADGSNLETYNEVDADNYADFLGQVADEVFIKLTTDAFAIFWFGPTHQHVTYLAIKNAGFTVNDVPGIWVKESGQTQQPSLNLANCYEPFYVARKGGPPLKKQGRSNVFQFKAVPGASKYHPTQRPIELMQEILSTFVYTEKMRILVPFLGSGVTIRAAFNLGMLATGWDLSEEYRNKFLLQIREDVKSAESNTENLDAGSAGGEGGDTKKV